ncbi:UNKNOWN [Stylonychia lemnae]|uniref:Transmembrane protein n=1 Tax=Stylonychia lemnae TaxID=5949 RepID=A0A078AMI6_STYLE|nr:UNKNOWN [Stylonychia lemnae]|eukprot:CDW82073.1 UNKNOWN [Stylonychia lemnae]
MDLLDISSLQSQDPIMNLLKSDFQIYGSQISNLQTYKNQVPIIFSEENLYFINTTFYNLTTNKVQIVDGLIANLIEGSITINNSRLEKVASSGNGGGLFMSNDISSKDYVELTIENSTIENMRAQDLGGFIYSENGQGGALYTVCDSNTKIGGFMKYDFFLPLDNNNVYQFNDAAYGKDFAAYPIKMQLKIKYQGVDMVIDPTKISQLFQDYFRTPSGLKLENPFSLVLYDVYDQQIMTDDSSLATVSIAAKQNASVTKNTKVKASRGIYYFDDFILKAEPNTTIYLTFTSNAINQNIIKYAIPSHKQTEQLVRGGNESVCLEGYTGNLCHQCEYSISNDIKYQRKGLHRCTPCPDHVQNSFIILGMVILAVLIIFVLIRTALINAASDKNHEPALMRIIIDYFHLIMILKFYDLNWPNSLEAILDIVSIVGEINERIFSIDCYIRGTLIKLIISLFVPFFFLALMYFFWRFCCCCLKEKQKKKERNKLKKYSIFQGIKEEAVKQEKTFEDTTESLKRKTIVSASILFYLTYPLICMKGFGMLGCVTLDNQKEYLIEDIDVVCWSEQHKLWVICLALPCILVWLKFNQYRFFLLTALKAILIIYNKLMVFNDLIYKTLFAGLTLIIFKQLIIKLKPYENDQFNDLQQSCFNICDQKRWDHLKTSYVDLYEGQFDYTKIVNAVVMIAHIIFFLLCIRELLIMHKNYLLHKSPKSFVKWIDKLTERPFNVSLRWLCAIPEESDDSEMTLRDQQLLKILQQHDFQQSKEDLNLSQNLTLNQTQQRLINSETTNITMNQNQQDQENQKREKDIISREYDKKQDISMDSYHPLAFTLSDFQPVFNQKQLNQHYANNLQMDSSFNELYIEENKFEQGNTSKDLSFGQYLRNLHQTDKGALKAILPEFEDTRHNFINRAFNEGIEQNQQLQQKKLKNIYKEQRSPVKRKNAQFLKDFEDDSFEIDENYSDEGDKNQNQHNDDSQIRKGQVIIDQYQGSSIQKIQIKQLGQKRMIEKIQTLQMRRKPVNITQIIDFSNRYKDHINKRKSQTEGNNYNFTVQSESSEDLSNRSEDYDIYQGPQSHNSPSSFANEPSLAFGLKQQETMVATKHKITDLEQNAVIDEEEEKQSDDQNQIQSTWKNINLGPSNQKSEKINQNGLYSKDQSRKVSFKEDSSDDFGIHQSIKRKKKNQKKI